MALSYYSNWGSAGTLEEHMSDQEMMSMYMSSMSMFPQPDLLGFDNNDLNLSDSSFISTCDIDPLLFIDPHINEYDDYVVDNDQLLLSHNYNYYTNLPPPLISSTHDNHLFHYSQQFDESYDCGHHRYPKCQKISYADDISYCSDFSTTQSVKNGFVPIDILVPEFHVDPPPPRVYNWGMNDDDDDDDQKSTSSLVVKKLPSTSNGAGGTTRRSLSAQSIAARERRRKISDKTQELGKLIPGAHKFNTAQMFEAAFNYIKFLQSQVGILQFIEKNGEGCHTKELQHLVQSPLIQEKLYSEEKCLLPKKFVETLAKDPQLHSTHSVIKDINQLIQPPS